MVFEYLDYKQCVNDWIKRQPKGGHGQLRQMANHLGINSVVMSQIFRGSRELTLEQALAVTNWMNLSEIERDYFLLLVQKDRAGTYELKQVLENQLVHAKKAAQSLTNRIKHQKLTSEHQAIFYSHWSYSAVRLGVSIPELGSVDNIAKHLRLEPGLVAKVVEFLIRQTLVLEKDGMLSIGPGVTHVGHDSTFANRHHLNWRVKALQALDQRAESNLFYTGPMALSIEASSQIRAQLIRLIEKATQLATHSESHTLRCLNIDWFDLAGN